MPQSLTIKHFFWLWACLVALGITLLALASHLPGWPGSDAQTLVMTVGLLCLVLAGNASIIILMLLWAKLREQYSLHNPMKQNRFHRIVESIRPEYIGWGIIAALLVFLWVFLFVFEL